MRVAFIGLRAIGICAGGIERHVEELALRMARQGIEVTVYCRKRYNTLGEGYFQGVRLVNLPALNTKHLEAISHTALAVLHALRGYDIIHIHALGPALLSWLPRLAGNRVVVTVHGLDFLRGKWGLLASGILRLGALVAAHCSSHTIVVSRQLRGYFAKRYAVDTTYIPNGISAPTLRPLQRLGRFGLEKNSYILFLGRLVPEKGAHDLIEAFRACDCGLKLVIAGGSSHSDTYVESLHQAAANDERIVFTGPLFGEDKDEAFSNAALFVLPSLLEGMPIVLLEAMSYGCPVLASDIPECLEVVQEHTPPLTWTFRAGNSHSLATMLGEVLASGERVDRGARAREAVLARYEWDGIVAETLQCYQAALKC